MCESDESKIIKKLFNHHKAKFPNFLNFILPQTDFGFIINTS